METVSRGSGPAHDHGQPVADRDRRSHLGRVAALVGLGGLAAYVGLVDPGSGSSLYPPCPSHALLGIDCPGCGGLRGTHDLLNGDIVGALDHNLLLPLLLALYAYGAVIAFAPLVGRHVPSRPPPRWLLATGIAVMAVFMVLRNLPIAGLEFLDSGTG